MTNIIRNPMHLTPTLPTPHQPRYAFYFAPTITNVIWWTADSHWLGRDAATDAAIQQVSIVDLSPTALQQLTTDARQYRFHATLKALFRLAEDFSENDLVTMIQAFSSLQNSLEIKKVGIHPLENFLALQTTDHTSKSQISALAMRCVRYFDLLRAALSAAELSKRRKVNLTRRQEKLLVASGLSVHRRGILLSYDLIDAVIAMRAAAESCFACALTMLLTIDGLTIFKESAPGVQMTVWQHFPFSNQTMFPCKEASYFPLAGRLFFVVGHSGVGKDALLQWVTLRLAKTIPASSLPDAVSPVRDMQVKRTKR
ncbi:MAG: DUF1045 domain-containing protein [Glaciimonas sp.]|nr:DUF1045 domain-containing protein [Glaciimonas sp.]